MIDHVLPVSSPLSNNGPIALASLQLNAFVHPEELSFSFYFFLKKIPRAFSATRLIIPTGEKNVINGPVSI
jgi:hypothetical protein